MAAAPAHVSTAPILWAQRKDSLFVTINIPDVDPAKATITLDGQRLTFEGTSGKTAYKTTLEFLHEVDATDTESKYDVKPRCILFHVIKKDKDSEYWPRLLKDKTQVRRPAAITFALAHPPPVDARHASWVRRLAAPIDGTHDPPSLACAAGEEPGQAGLVPLRGRG